MKAIRDAMERRVKGVVVSAGPAPQDGKEHRAMLSVASALGATLLVPIPPALGLPPEQVVHFAPWESPAAWAVVALLGLTGIGALTLTDVGRTAARALRRLGHAHPIRRRLPAGWNTDLDTQVTHPPRSGAGGSNGRVPPRPAAGSSPLRVVRRA